MKHSVLCMIVLMLAASCGGNHGSGNEESAGRATLDPWTADSMAYAYWGSPASPRRDDRRYIQFLDSLLACDSLPEAFREQAEQRKRMAMLNLPGSLANDFRYLERSGKEFTLHDLSSGLTLLIFYDPECPHCNDILRSIARSETINKAVVEKNLTVLAIYAEGKHDVWDTTRNNMPQNWLVGYDLTGILDEELYNLPAMPTPYLLDSNKRVILKDPEIPGLIARIKELSNKD